MQLKAKIKNYAKEISFLEICDKIIEIMNYLKKEG